jgi:hypothetical protein
MDKTTLFFIEHFGASEWVKNSNRFYLNKAAILFRVGKIEDKYRLLKSPAKFYYQQSNNKLYCKDGNDMDVVYIDMIKNYLKDAGIEIKGRGE